jgi:2-phospho-L-lactate guanylyltransferase
MILIPVKNLDNAKQRLAQVLPQCDRTELAHAMLKDVLEAVSQAGADEVALVTSDPFAFDLAASFNFELIRDDSNLSETDAIAAATQVCLRRGIQTTVVLPGDIPLIEAGEIEQIYDSAPDRGCVLVPSADKRGTNAVLRRPSALFPLRFGNDSFMPHLTAAINTNTSCVVLSLPGIALDIDTPDDLHQLAVASGDRKSRVLARQFGFGQVPAAVNS